MRRHDDARRARTVGAAADRAEVARIGHPVEHREERLRLRGQLVRVGVAIGLDHRDEPLVVARRGPLGQVALALHLRARLGQPRLGLQRAFGRPHLEHRTPAAQRLTDGLAAIDEVRCHGLAANEHVAAARLVAHLPAERGKLVAQAVRSGEIPLQTGVCAPFGQRRNLGRSLLADGQRVEPEERQTALEQLHLPVRGPFVQDRQGARGVEVVVESRRQRLASALQSTGAGASVNAFRSVWSRAVACSSVSSE